MGVHTTTLGLRRGTDLPGLMIEPSLKTRRNE